MNLNLFIFCFPPPPETQPAVCIRSIKYLGVRALYGFKSAAPDAAVDIAARALSIKDPAEPRVKDIAAVRPSQRLGARLQSTPVSVTRRVPWDYLMREHCPLLIPFCTRSEASSSRHGRLTGDMWDGTEVTGTPPTTLLFRSPLAARLRRLLSSREFVIASCSGYAKRREESQRLRGRDIHSYTRGEYSRRAVWFYSHCSVTKRP